MGDDLAVPIGELWSQLLDPVALFQFLTMALIIAWIAGRLLGASKRSWRAVFITGVSGWLVALPVAAYIVRGDLTDPAWRQVGPMLMLLFIMLATVIYRGVGETGETAGSRFLDSSSDPRDQASIPVDETTGGDH